MLTDLALRAYGYCMGMGTDLTLVSINAETGHAGFGPALAYSLALAELVDLAVADRIALRGIHIDMLDPAPAGDALPDDCLARLAESTQPVLLERWLAQRGPWRIDAHVEALAGMNILRIATPAVGGGARIEVTDRPAVREVDRALRAVIAGGRESTAEQCTFAALVRLSGWPQIHLRGWAHRRDRVRLARLAASATRHDADRGQTSALLRHGGRMVPKLARSARAHGPGKNIDSQIGLTDAGRTAAIWFNAP